MRYLFITMSMVLFVVLGCKKNNASAEALSQSENSQAYKITSRDIDQLKYTDFALSDLADASTKDWLKFRELLSQIDILKKGDLSFFKDDKAILVSFITDLKNEIPEVVNTVSVVVRLSVLETVLFKLEGVSNLNNVNKDVLLKAVKEVLVAHSNLILQINKKFEKESQADLIDSPLFRNHRRIQAKLSEFFGVIRAVSFPVQRE